MVDLRVMTDTSTNQVRKLNAASEANAEAVPGSASSNDATGESLSALMDSEASEIEIHRLLKLSEFDPAVRQRWQRYQLVRSVLKGELESDPATDLSAQISAAISQEEPLQGTGRAKRWTHGAGKVAIAASVAFAFIVGVQQMGPAAPGSTAETAEAPAATGDTPAGDTGFKGTVPSGFELPPFAARTVSAGGDAGSRAAPQLINSYSQGSLDTQLQNNRALQQHFDGLLLKHAERASTNGNMGLLPFARVPSLEGAPE